MGAGVGSGNRGMRILMQQSAFASKSRRGEDRFPSSVLPESLRTSTTEISQQQLNDCIRWRLWQDRTAQKSRMTQARSLLNISVRRM
eukprot:752172-Hanusia_phi.AAC.3